MENRQWGNCHSHLIYEKPRWQRYNVTRENKLAMGGEIKDGRVNKGNNIFCAEC